MLRLQKIAGEGLKENGQPPSRWNGRELNTARKDYCFPERRVGKGEDLGVEHNPTRLGVVLTNVPFGSKERERKEGSFFRGVEQSAPWGGKKVGENTSPGSADRADSLMGRKEEEGIGGGVEPVARLQRGGLCKETKGWGGVDLVGERR